MPQLAVDPLVRTVTTSSLSSPFQVRTSAKVTTLVAPFSAPSELMFVTRPSNTALACSRESAGVGTMHLQARAGAGEVSRPSALSAAAKNTKMRSELIARRYRAPAPHATNGHP